MRGRDAAAGVGCSTCHSEHRGRDFRPAVASLSADFQPEKVRRENTCTGCHNDANKKLYNGRHVSTPHGGTFGYPVANGQWEWDGLSATALREKPEGVRQLLAAFPVTNENERRNAQFHALHLHRVRAVGGLKANEAGELTCSSCHTRWGASLDRETPKQTCAGCHSDANKASYNGRRVSTPHGGTFGYPVVAGEWKWKGLSEAQWNQKPEEVRALLASWPAKDERERRSVQFHALHLHRVRAVGGLAANDASEMTCSSCHRSLGASLDRETPRTTCAACHNGRTDERTGRALVAASAPNCTSCHVQHAKDRSHFDASLLAGGAKD